MSDTDYILIWSTLVIMGAITLGTIFSPAMFFIAFIFSVYTRIVNK